MPGASNPVSDNPVSGISQSKSLRSRLGFGGSSGSAPSIKPSFFSQLNLKSGRKSLGGSADLRFHDHSILVIDSEIDHGKLRHGTHIRVSKEAKANLQENAMKNGSGSPPRSNTSRPTHNLSYSLPGTSKGTSVEHYFLNSRTDLDISPTRNSTLSTRKDADDSGLSKHLPEISADLSLLVNEPLPSDAVSQGSQGSVINIAPHSTMRQERDQTQRQLIREPINQDSKIFPVVSSPSGLSSNGVNTSENIGSRMTDMAGENTSASFDLSNARLSLELMRHSLDEDWAKSVVLESGSAISADSSLLPVPLDSSMRGSGSGPITSTPFRTPSASLSQPRTKEADISFDLEALDPDLVALLRPNNYNSQQHQVTHVLSPSPEESFSPPPDPLNPAIIVQQRADRIASSPPAPPYPISSRLPIKSESPTPPTRKYASISSSTSVSPLRQHRIQQTHTAQEIFPTAQAPKPNSPLTVQSDIPWLQTHGHDIGQPHSSDTGTPSDMSKQPSPLSAPPLTLDDLQHQQPSEKTMNGWDVPADRKLRNGLTAFVQPLLAVSTSSSDSRPVPRYTPRNRDLRPASASPEASGPSIAHSFGSVGRERERARLPVDGLFSKQPSPVGIPIPPASTGTTRSSHPNRSRLYSNAGLPSLRDREREMGERRYRKRSMSLDQSPFGYEGRKEDLDFHAITKPRFTRVGDRIDSVGYPGSEHAYGVSDVLGTPYDGQDLDLDRDRYGYGYSDRERIARPHTDWLGPRTAKAFAAAGLLDDPKDISGQRYGAFSRSSSERDFRTPSSIASRERRSPISSGFSINDIERERESFRHNLVSSRSEFKYSGRSGAISPSVTSTSRPLSRIDSWSHSRPAPLFSRTMSDLMSHRSSTDGRDSASGTHPRSGSGYSVGGGGTVGGSSGSGGGRASPTTTSSLLTAQSQIQNLKDKHDTQTEALLAALADSQRTCREVREENDTLKNQVASLEERLVEAIANLRQKEKELTRLTRPRPIYSPDRTRTATTHRDPEPYNYSRQPAPPNPSVRSTPSPIKRRISTSSVFPVVPSTMTLLTAESPAPDSVAGSSPSSPTLVLPQASRRSSERNGSNNHEMMRLDAQPIPMSHKRSTSGTSMTTSVNFSLDSGSPGSLKLKPEHEHLLGDMTQLSLLTGFSGDSEAES